MAGLQEHLRRILPRWRVVYWGRNTYLFFSLILNVLRDALRFAKYSALLRYRSTDALVSRIMMESHTLEKGLALPEPRPGFGEAVVSLLVQHLDDYVIRSGHDQVTDMGAAVLAAYSRFNLVAADSENAPQRLANEFLERYGATQPNAPCAGIEAVDKSDILDANAFDFERFVRSRHSVRDFSEEEVAIDLITKAVGLAQTSPSVCNRQSARIHVMTDRDTIEQCLELQAGARGFSSCVNKVIICTADMGRMVSVGERYQCFLDGGMYAMSLVYALHSLGLGTCCLNWCKAAVVDRALRRIVPIPNSEVVLMFIAVGHLRQSFRVTCSPQLRVRDVLTLHQ